MSSLQTSIDQLNSTMSSLDSFLLTGTLNVTALAASVDSVAAAIVPPQPTTSNTLTALAAAEARPTSHILMQVGFARVQPKNAGCAHLQSFIYQSSGGDMCWMHRITDSQSASSLLMARAIDHKECGGMPVPQPERAGACWAAGDPAGHDRPQCVRRRQRVSGHAGLGLLCSQWCAYRTCICSLRVQRERYCNGQNMCYTIIWYIEIDGNDSIIVKKSWASKSTELAHPAIVMQAL